MLLFSLKFSTMLGRGKKTKKTTTPVTPNKRAKWRSGHKSPCLAVAPGVVQSGLTADDFSHETPASLKMPQLHMEAPEIIDIMLDVSSRLQGTELCKKHKRIKPQQQS